jgi:hypothetical protein
MKMPSMDLIGLAWKHAGFLMAHREDKGEWDEQATILREHAKTCPGC